MARATCCRCAGPAKRPLAFDRDYASKRRSTEDPKSMALTTGIQGIGPSASCWCRRIPSTSLCGRKLYYLRYDRAKNTDPRSLSTSTTTGSSPPCLCGHAEPPAVSGGRRKAELCLLFRGLSTGAFLFLSGRLATSSLYLPSKEQNTTRRCLFRPLRR